MASVWGGTDIDDVIDFDNKKDIWECPKGHRFNYRKIGKYCPVQQCGYELKPQPEALHEPGSTEPLRKEKKTRQITKVVKRCPDGHTQPMGTDGRCSLCFKLGHDVLTSSWVEVDEEEYAFFKDDDEVWRPDPLDNLTALREPGDPPRDLSVVNPFRVPLSTSVATGWHPGPPGSGRAIRPVPKPKSQDSL